jgi:hypothetical protein
VTIRSGILQVLNTGGLGQKIKFKCNVEVNPPGDQTAVGPACLPK